MFKIFLNSQNYWLLATNYWLTLFLPFNYRRPLTLNHKGTGSRRPFQ